MTEKPENMSEEKLETIERFVEYLDGDSEWALDPKVEKELDNALSEEGVIGMFQGGENAEERIPLIEKFSPDENEWGGKSIFTQGQPRNVTLADNLPIAFPVLKPTEEFINKFVEDYEMRLTSVDGVSRDQLMRIFRAMFGSGTGEGEEAASTLQLALSAGPEDSD